MQATIILPNGEVDLVSLLGNDDARLRQLQEIVGGHIEAVSLPGERCMVINENGKDAPHMVNHTATAIVPTDYIAGVAVILPAEVLQ